MDNAADKRSVIKVYVFTWQYLLSTYSTLASGTVKKPVRDLPLAVGDLPPEVGETLYVVFKELGRDIMSACVYLRNYYVRVYLKM